MSESLLQNKKAYFNYEITEKFTAGIELFGFEVKSVREKKGQIENAYVTIRGGEAYLIGANIPAYQLKNAPVDFDPLRNRKLLLTKKELKQLANIENKKGLTIVAIAVYNAGRKLKLEIGIAKGKKSFDKRENIKKRETDREIRRTLKNE
ncbi:MAG: SsrA-binding protein [Candidatus Taylorbacteria bacterium RIFOXYD2_FULL_36_9]|uniref:SsrA-binding protein n=1 Tax=Candidatus Taylorbacteria bacterium RIFOXYD2_FULL_36_9 TaxID=1802338 RepID=A0A1G2PGK9_9BACT|nr:MAG: SsrA-binding protein [Candidatus Taylorbacteria bacterium RIFOXYD2_FULL_36_9]